MVSIFVFGLLAGDVGKTAVSSAIARGLVRRGFDVGVFKPVSEHDLWHGYDTYLKCKEEGRLFCEDIVRLHNAAMVRDLPYEISNPVDALETFRSPAAGSGFQTVLIERYTLVKRRMFNVLSVNSQVASKSLDPDFICKLKNYAERTVGVGSDEKFKELRSYLAPKAVESCYKVIEERYSHVIVESHEDRVCPAPSLRYDVVIGVAPGVAVLFDAEKFNAGVQNALKSGTPVDEVNCNDVEQYLEKNSVIRLPLLPSKTLNNYEHLSEEFNLLVKIVAKEIERLES
nr:hypothetical protein [Candidatus Bathyarchaeota archaeon]